MTINLCFSPFYFGYGLAYFGTFDFPVIKSIFGISMDDDLANGLLQASIPLGGGIGALSSFLLLKYLSRR